MLKVATNVLKEEAGSISKAHGITSSNSNNKSNNSTNRTNMDKYDTADDKVISESDSSMNADNKKTSFCSSSKTNAISNQKAKNDEDNNLLVDSYKLKMIRELKTRVNIHRF